MSPVQLVQLLLLWQYLCLVSSSASSATFFFLTLEKNYKHFIFFRYLRGLIHLPVTNDVDLL